MFTGIVEELGTVASRDGSRLRINASLVLDGSRLGDSIAVNGCCLTLVEQGEDVDGETYWEADVTDETYSRTSLGDLRPGARVNLERPVRLEDRLGGHLVQGHVDAVGEIVVPAPDLRVRMPSELTRYIVEKGSITVDGVSLTVNEVDDAGFEVALIPHTVDHTAFHALREGDAVNIEVDLLARYVERLLATK